MYYDLALPENGLRIAGRRSSLPEWAGLVGLVLSTGGALVVAPGLLRYLFPALALATGLFLYLKNSSFYISLTLWLWFLTPLLRRLIDFRIGFMEPNPVLLAPLLVTAISADLIIRRLNRHALAEMLPFILCGLGVTLGFVVGTLEGTPKEAASAFLNWMAPLTFGYYLLSRASSFESNSKLITANLAAGVLVCGLYGIYEYVSAPPWDCYWLENIEGEAFGLPNPFEIRVWGTLNSPGTFAFVLMVGLLLLFGAKTWLKIPAVLVGYAAFLLSLVRADWFGWSVGFLLLTVGSRKQLSRRLLAAILVGAAVAVAVLWSPAGEVIRDRFQSFSSLNEDESARDRAETYERLGQLIAQSPMGEGLDNSRLSQGLAMDSGVLAIPIKLGWFGGLSYIVGVGMLLLPIRSHRMLAPQVASFRQRALGQPWGPVCIAILVQLPLGLIFTGVFGVLFWTSGAFVSLKASAATETCVTA